MGRQRAFRGHPATCLVAGAAPHGCFALQRSPNPSLMQAEALAAFFLPCWHSPAVCPNASVPARTLTRCGLTPLKRRAARLGAAIGSIILCPIFGVHGISARMARRVVLAAGRFVHSRRERSCRGLVCGPIGVWVFAGPRPGCKGASAGPNCGRLVSLFRSAGAAARRILLAKIVREEIRWCLIYLSLHRLSGSVSFRSPFKPNPLCRRVGGGLKASFCVVTR
ncbi:uncharacterized protein Tco025E_08911 [Trypanosoma conorhini]|uniref:Uncharacterized protein n=1 Tax=Trypanosoma conorhini TaxID=83891 RepID=A0A3R7LMH4_9TRYP|nr:uncharacterized protein Tco025E_08911 [Trypanosoma conorhini]RNE99886.1 hypothetical protein Tco025E_08911 [Trypanosoma conorhini]